MRGRAWLNRPQARGGLAVLAAAATGIGGAALLAGGPVGRLAGLPDGAGSALALRLFGLRELALGVRLYRSHQRDDARQARLMAGLTAAVQAGDLLVTTAMLARGRASRRFALAVWLGAPPTLLLSRAIHRAYSGRFAGH